MCGCESCADVCASRVKRVRIAGIVRELGRQHLDRDGAVEPEIARAIDDRHPAAADLALELVLAAEGGDHSVVQRLGHALLSIVNSTETGPAEARAAPAGAGRCRRT